MSARLPLVSAYEKQHTDCAYCPKMCRFSCPVSTAQARETTTPWAKMTSLHHVAEANLRMSRSIAATWYACTGCMRCRTHCTHQNDVSGALHAARGEAVNRGEMPREAQSVIDKHPARVRRVASAATSLYGPVQSEAKVAFVPGCTATVLSPEDGRLGLAICEQLTEQQTTAIADGCCGLPLLDAGDIAGFVKVSAAWISRLSHFDSAVFLDPGCLHALVKRARELGVRLPTTAMMHISELAANQIDRLRPLNKTMAMRYHDPCRLGRGLGKYDEPRRVLARILGRPVDEFHHRREDSACSGAGGQLPRTDRTTAHAIAERRAEENEWVGGGKIVSACPGSTRQLRGASITNTSVVSFVSLLSKSLRQA